MNGNFLVCSVLDALSDQLAIGQVGIDSISELAIGNDPGLSQRPKHGQRLLFLLSWHTASRVVDVHRWRSGTKVEVIKQYYCKNQSFNLSIIFISYAPLECKKAGN